MPRRFQAWIVILAVALQAIDGIVGALGHSHGHPHDSQALAARAEHAHAGGCSHHHTHALNSEQERKLPADGPEPGDHGDCSLCRHFSQSAAPLTIAIVLVGHERVGAVAAPPVQRTIAPALPAHLARGPPALFASI